MRRPSASGSGRLDGLKVAICGDIKHSRVARSNAKLLPRLGAEVRLAGPPELMPDDVPACRSTRRSTGADVVMMLRVQRERLAEDLGDAPGEYLERYGLTAERLARAAPDAVVMHPGPINRGIEIDGAIADDPTRSLIVRQVEMGVAMRMACLEMLVGGADLARGDLHRRVAGEGADEAGPARALERRAQIGGFGLVGKALDRQAIENALGAE